MKFHDYLKTFDLTAEKYGLGFFVYDQEMDLAARQTLFTLTDYRVSSYGAGSYFLLPI
mgnify:CR=1 FL=1